MAPAQPYDATWESLNQHDVPRWFQDAKFGIFIHWGIYSVPAWAPVYPKQGQHYDEPAGYIPYAELYGYGLRYKHSPVWQYHVQRYGAAFQYDDFIPMFTAAQWDPASWAQLFHDIGARYVVLVTRHSDDYSLWPTKYSERNAFLSGPRRDLVGDLTAEVRKQHLKMGLYYSLTFDVYHDRYPHRPYVEYAHNQVKELVDQYAPDLLWSDDYWKSSEKSLASTWNSEALIAYFYNHAADPAEALVNDRWGKATFGRLLGDYATPEYAAITTIPPFYWEATRGIGHSFGYNRAETEAHYLSVEALVHLLVDVVSKNGNLLLNVGPTADGLLPPLQEERLRGLGAWLRANGEAIYETQPWICAEGTTGAGEAVRFTMKDNTLYVIVLGAAKRHVTLKHLVVPAGASIRLLGFDGPLSWHNSDDGLHIDLSSAECTPHAYCLQITPQPWMLMRHTVAPPVAPPGPTWRQYGSLYIP